MFLVIDAGKTSENGNTLAVPAQFRQLQQINIRLQNFTRIRIERTSCLQRLRGRIVLKIRIAHGSAGIHDAGLPFSTDIEIPGMVETEGMSVFMRRRRGIMQQVIQFEIPGIAVDTIHKGNMGFGKFLNTEIVVFWVRVVPDGFRLYLRHVKSMDHEFHRECFPPDAHDSLSLIPVTGNVGRNDRSQFRPSRITIKIEIGTDDEPPVSGMDFCFSHAVKNNESGALRTKPSKAVIMSSALDTGLSLRVIRKSKISYQQQ